MPETVMKGVSLYTRDRARSHDAFDLALDQLGIEIRRPGQSPRHLNWERITEWEITQRRGGVLLILRGDGAATPLIIPNWRVDQLDQVLREVTASVPPPPPEAYDEAFPLESEYRAPARAGSTAPGPVDLHDDLEDGDVEGTLVWPNHSPLNSLPNLTWPEDGIDRDALSRVDPNALRSMRLLKQPLSLLVPRPLPRPRRSPHRLHLASRPPPSGRPRPLKYQRTIFTGRSRLPTISSPRNSPGP
jgi:hypothetical protein